MKDNKQHRRHKNTAASKLFNTSYVPTISELVITKHGPSYENVTTLGKTWRTNIEYKPEIEEFLISRTRLFIRTLDTRDSNSTNPQFLRSLTNMIADYLSKYTARSSQQLTRKKAIQFLTNALYDNFNYIQTIIRMINIKKDAANQTPGRRGNRVRKYKQTKTNSNQKTPVVKVNGFMMTKYKPMKTDKIK